jgi:hypothetical protein
MIIETTRDGETLKNGALTKKRIRELADRSLRYGYLSSGHGGHGTTVTVWCPLASNDSGWSDAHRVSGTLDQYSAEGTNVRRVITRALADHFDPDNYPAGTDRSEHLCGGMRPVVRTEAVR